MAPVSHADFQDAIRSAGGVENVLGVFAKYNLNLYSQTEQKFQGGFKKYSKGLTDALKDELGLKISLNTRNFQKFDENWTQVLEEVKEVQGNQNISYLRNVITPCPQDEDQISQAISAVSKMIMVAAADDKSLYDQLNQKTFFGIKSVGKTSSSPKESKYYWEFFKTLIEQERYKERSSMLAAQGLKKELNYIASENDTDVFIKGLENINSSSASTTTGGGGGGGGGGSSTNDPLTSSASVTTTAPATSSGDSSGGGTFDIFGGGGGGGGGGGFVTDLFGGGGGSSTNDPLTSNASVTTTAPATSTQKSERYKHLMAGLEKAKKKDSREELWTFFKTEFKQKDTSFLTPFKSTGKALSTKAGLAIALKNYIKKQYNTAAGAQPSTDSKHPGNPASRVYQPYSQVPHNNFGPTPATATQNQPPFAAADQPQPSPAAATQNQPPPAATAQNQHYGNATAHNQPPGTTARTAQPQPPGTTARTAQPQPPETTARTAPSAAAPVQMIPREQVQNVSLSLLKQLAKQNNHMMSKKDRELIQQEVAEFNSGRGESEEQIYQIHHYFSSFRPLQAQRAH